MEEATYLFVPRSYDLQFACCMNEFPLLRREKFIFDIVFYCGENAFLN